MKLIIIEAPGKINKVKEAIAFLTDSSDYEVIATSGQIYDLPKKEIGIDYSDFSEKKILRNKKISEKIIEKASKSEFIYLMTDNDDVGEQISRDVLYLINDVYKKPFSRVRISSMNPKEISNAIRYSKKNNLDQSMIDSSDARRIINRTVGYGLFERHGGIEKAAPFGSLVIPVISEMMKPETICGFIKSFILNKNSKLPLKAKIPVSRKVFGNEEIIIKKLNKIINKVSDNDIIIEDLKEDNNILNCYDALSKFSRHLDKDISFIEKNLQSSYERGNISYFRTPSREAFQQDSEEQKIMEKYFALEEQDIEQGDLDELDILANSRRNKDPHLGISSVSSNVNINDDISYMDDSEVICSLVAKYNILKMSDIDSRSISCIVDLEEKDVLELRRMGVMIQDSSIKYEVILKKPNKSIFEKVYDEDICFHDLIDKAVYKKHSPLGNAFHIQKNENTVLDIMEKNGIGKPSTYGYQSSSIGKFFDNKMNPNGLAKAGYMLAKKHAPELININNMKKIEEILDNNEISFNDKIEEGLKIIGLNKNDLYEKFKPDEDMKNKNYKKRKTDFEFN